MTSFVADLHLHTTASDGRYSPADVVHQAHEKGLSTIAITDHDTVDGVIAAQQAGDNCGVEVITGCEFSVVVGDREIHLLGYFFQVDDAAIEEYCDAMETARRKRAQMMVDRLRTMGCEITYEMVQEKAGGNVIGRPHIAEAMVAAGFVDTEQQAFDEFIADGKPGYVQKPRRPAEEAIEMIHGAGGITVLAHPGHWTRIATVRSLKETGLDGIEVSHPAHDDNLRKYYIRKAAQFELLESGGSDFHGRADEETNIGKYGVDESQLEKLRERVGRYREPAVGSSPSV